MKKLILTAAAAMMVLASCTKTTVESIDGPKEIAFKKIEGAMTKTVAENLAGNTTMGVFAYLNGTTTEYFGNASFSKGTTYWEGDKYWPLNGQALDFVVYAPHMSTDGNTKIDYTNKTLKFTIENNSESQTDYLYGAEYYDNSDNNSDSKDDGFTYDADGVAVKLKHALAQITVKVNANANNVFTITNITLNNTEQGGTITVVYDESTDAASVTSCQATSEETTDTDIEMYLIKNTETPVTTDLKDVTKSCLVFPGDNTNKRYQTSLTITYKMEGLATEQITTLNLQADPSNPSSTWDSGKHYIYNLTLKANQILFNPEVVDWDSTADTNKEITGTGNVNL